MTNQATHQAGGPTGSTVEGEPKLGADWVCAKIRLIVPRRKLPSRHTNAQQARRAAPPKVCPGFARRTTVFRGCPLPPGLVVDLDQTALEHPGADEAQPALPARRREERDSLTEQHWDERDDVLVDQPLAQE